MTTISIALTTYNGERFLWKQLESLARQTHLPDELVVVDDCSDDVSVSLLERFAVQAPFLVRIYSNKKRLGWRANFMKAAELCSGKIIFFCDQDDVWYKDKIEHILTLMSDNRVLLAYHNADLIDVEGRVVGVLRSEDKDVADLPPRSRPTIWSNPFGLTIAFRRELLLFHPYWSRTADPRDTKIAAAHDQWFFHLASNLGYVRYTPERLLGYRQHGGNAVGFNTEKSVKRSRFGWDPSKDAYIEMLEKFCRVLEFASSDQIAGFETALIDALHINSSLLQRLLTIRAAHNDVHVLRRMGHLIVLIKQQAFSSRTEWNLGKMALLNAAFIGIPTGR